MTHDLLEDRLRTALHGATSSQEGAYLDLDASLVLARGRHVVRRRRVTAGLSLAAATVVVGLVGWSTLGGGAERATVPGGSSSVRAEGTVSADLVRPTATPHEGAGAVSAQGFRVTMDRTTGTARVLARVGGEWTQVASVQRPDNPRASAFVDPKATPGTTVGLVPEEATELTLAWAGDEAGAPRAAAPLPGTGYQAVAVWHAGNETFAGLDWTDGEVVHDTSGARVRAARFGRTVVFHDERQDLMGVFEPGSVATKPISDTVPGALPILVTGQLAATGSSMETSVLVVLPRGADLTDVEASPGATILDTHNAGGGSTAESLVLVRLSVPTSMNGSGIAKVSWTGPTGQELSSSAGF